MQAKRSLTCLIDIVFLAAAASVIEGVFEGVIPFSADIRVRILAALFGKLLILAVVWCVLRFHGEKPAEIGFKTPPNRQRAISLGGIIGGAVFVAVFLLERAGLHRDLSAFDFLRGNLEATIYQSIFVIVGAGFYEEVLFRGFLFQRLALLLGGNRIAWAIACVLQAIVFGSQHAYQNPVGMILTGGVGLVFGIVFLNCGRNLWPPIIAHALYDLARTILFYFNGPPA